MNIVIPAYCLLCFFVSAVSKNYLKRAWTYFIVSATLPPVVFLGGIALVSGYLDGWAKIAFVPMWFTALGCSVVYYLLKRLIDRKRASRSGADDSFPR